MPGQDAARRQLGMIPFGNLIGGPLNAAIEAQAKAANTTLEFIQNIGFVDGGDTVRNVTLKYMNGDVQKTLEVPILTMVPIPYIRIDDMSIQFKASISASSDQTQTDSSSSSWEGKVSGSARYLFFKAQMSASYSSKKDSSATKNSKYAVEYTIDVNVHAVQDDMPGGMSKVLSLLTESIDREPAGTQQSVQGSQGTQGTQGSGQGKK